MAKTAIIQDEDLIDRLDALRPLLRAHAGEAEREKRLPAQVAEALRDAGFFRMLRPASRGGLGFDPVTAFRIGEALARIDSAAAWNVQVCNTSELFGGWFGDATSDEVFGSPNAVVAGAFNPPRRAVAVADGYRVSGRTPFNSGCHHATWFLGLADVFEGEEQPVGDKAEPRTLLIAIPAHECKIVENWNTLGMSGTGSHDVDVREVFVPKERTAPFGPLVEPSAAYDNPLSRMALWTTVGCHASVALGVAQAAIDDLAALGSKVPAYTQSAIQNRSTVQLRIARAEGKLEAARSYFHAAYDEAWAAVSKRGHLELREKSRCQSASSTAALTAAEVVDLVHSCVGTAGIREEQRFQKHFRDAHVITQHAFLSEARLEAVGQIMFGLEPDWGFFAF
jgi:alkylation response protein AidB-like acyl-CoA dehydrogenase